MTHQQKHIAKMTTYEAMGLAAMLPGMQHMITLMQRELDNMRAALARVQERQNGYAELGSEESKAVKVGSAQAAYWARMTPEQRSAEMKRRGMVRGQKAKTNGHAATLGLTKSGKPAKMHPRDPRHPGHDAWRKRCSKANKASWARLTPEQHAARVAAVQGRRAA